MADAPTQKAFQNYATMMLNSKQMIQLEEALVAYFDTVSPKLAYEQASRAFLKELLKTIQKAVKLDPDPDFDALMLETETQLDTLEEQSANQAQRDTLESQLEQAPQIRARALQETRSAVEVKLRNLAVMTTADLVEDQINLLAKRVEALPKRMQEKDRIQFQEFKAQIKELDTKFNDIVAYFDLLDEYNVDPAAIRKAPKDVQRKIIAASDKTNRTINSLLDDRRFPLVCREALQAKVVPLAHRHITKEAYRVMPKFAQEAIHEIKDSREKMLRSLVLSKTEVSTTYDEISHAAGLENWLHASTPEEPTTKVFKAPKDDSLQEARKKKPRFDDGTAPGDYVAEDETKGHKDKENEESYEPDSEVEGLSTQL